MMFAPFNLFPEEMFIRAAIVIFSLLAGVIVLLVWFIANRIHAWSKKDLIRMMEKEAAIKEMTATRIWRETRG